MSPTRAIRRERIASQQGTLQKPLSNVEREVLRLLLTGLSNKAVALRMGLGIRTVERHRANALRKLGVSTLVEASRLSGWRLAAPVEGSPITPEVFATLFHGAAAAMHLVAPDGRVLTANATFCRMLDLREPELAQATVENITIPADVAPDLRRFRGLFTGERATYQTWKRFARRDGSLLLAHLTASVVTGADGAPLFAVGSTVID